VNTLRMFWRSARTTRAITVTSWVSTREAKG
jgi:hypothetical protein